LIEENNQPGQKEIVLTPRQTMSEFKKNYNFNFLVETFELESVYGS